jgi:hypothetical protein
MTEIDQVNALIVHGQPRQYCAACPARRGECPRCGTFWTPADGGAGKMYGVVRVDWPDGHVDGPTNGYLFLNQLPNVLGGWGGPSA